MSARFSQKSAANADKAVRVPFMRFLNRPCSAARTRLFILATPILQRAVCRLQLRFDRLEYPRGKSELFFPEHRCH